MFRDHPSVPQRISLLASAPGRLGNVSIQENHCYFRLPCRPSCLEKAAAGGGLITRRNCLQVSSSCVPPEVPNLEHTLPGHVSEKQPDRGDGQDRAQSPNRM